MSFQKLTYSGSECNNYVYFTFKGEFFDIDKITNELNIRPTKTRLKDDPVPKSTSWIHKINIGNEIDLTTPTKNLINLLEPKIDVIHKLKKELNLETRFQYVIDIDINPESSTPHFPLNKRIIKFLYQTETEVDFDIYKSDEIGMLKNE